MPSETAAESAAVSKPQLASLLPRDPTITLLVPLIAAAVMIFSLLAPSRFLSGDTVRAMAFQMPELGILSLAMMVPLMSGGLNLAIIATANLSALVMAAILTHLIQPSSPSLVVTEVIVLALFAGMVTTMVIGFLTGIIVAFFGVHPILVTLGTMTLVKGISVLTTSGTVIGGFFPPNPLLGGGSRFWIPPIIIFFFFFSRVLA